MRIALTGLGCLVLLGTSASAQKFSKETPFAGGTLWSEGVEVFDADGDGDLDVVFANGKGFSSAQTKQQARLYINDGTGAFSEESVTRLGTLMSYSKQVISADLDADGDQDLVFANAFNQVPWLMLNDGNGFYVNATGSNMVLNTINSAGVSAGDVDGDGDLDLAFMDSGSSLFGGSGATPKLYLNDGSAMFTDATSTHLPVKKWKAQQDAQLIDIDNDWDLDWLGACRISNPASFLYINDGMGHFTDGSAVLPNQSGSVYEIEWSDMDDDNDLDFFYISLSGFNEGTATNLLDTGSLGFTATTGTVTGAQGSDDNEVGFLDADNDGDLDALVGSLGSKEKLFLNNGAGLFAYTAAFANGTDSTLDLAIGDLDGDGDPDVITAQGESGNYTNKLWRNNGLHGPDSHAPSVRRLESAGSHSSGSPAVIRAWVQDGIQDDGKNGVTGKLTVMVGSQAAEFPMSDIGGGQLRGVIDLEAAGIAALGQTVTYRAEVTDRAGNVGLSAQQDYDICGFDTYSEGLGGTNSLTLWGTTGVDAGATASMEVYGLTGGFPAAGFLVISIAQMNLPVLGGTLLVDPILAALVPISLDPWPTTLDIPVPGNAAGAIAHLQVLALDAGTIVLSNGLTAAVCP